MAARSRSISTLLCPLRLSPRLISSAFNSSVLREETYVVTRDGRVLIVDQDDHSFYIFDVEGHQLGKFNIKYDERDVYYCIACHPANDHVVLAGRTATATLTLAICTVNGEFVRRIQLDVVRIVYGITVTVESHIGVAFEDNHHTVKVIVV